MKKNELIFISLLLAFTAGSLPGQVSMQADGRGYYTVTSYNGLSSNEDRAHKLQIALSGQNVNLSGWSVKARINTPAAPNIPNVSGAPFPTEKIKFRFTQEEINGNPPAPLPTLPAIGATMAAIPMNSPGVETPLIANSRVPLQTGSSYYVGILYYFAIDIEGGSYLSGMLSDNSGNPWNANPVLYQTTITFTLYDAGGVEVASHTLQCNIQVNRPLTDTPDTTPSYGIEVAGEARASVLELNSAGSYVNGAGATHRDGLKINSETGFEVTVRSVYAELTNPEGYALPVSVIRLQLLPGSNSAHTETYPAASLSTEPQLVLSSGSGGQATRLYTIHYSTQGNDSRLLNARKGSYSSTLIYQLTPR